MPNCQHPGLDRSRKCVILGITMPVFTIKLSPEEGRRLSRDARLRGQTKSAYVRTLLADRIQTTDDLLRAWEKGDIPPVRKRSSRRHAAA